MISKIKGKISHIGLQSIFIDNGFLELEVYVPLNVIEYFQNQKNKNKSYELYIYHHFFGEGQRLYGFLEFSQRELFRNIIQLKGIGISLGLSILSHLNVKQLIEICEKNDIKSLTRIPKIGKSIAENLIFEVNRKKKIFLQLLEKENKNISKENINQIYIEEAIQGLKYLGYKEKNILDTINKIKKSNKKIQSTSEWIREVLKEI